MTSVDRTVAFLDLSSFTALTDVHGDQAAIEVVDRFLDAIHGALEPGVELVKSLGDGALLVADRPEAALRVGAQVLERLHGLPAMPEISGGLHHGPLVQRDGDVFGAGVNLASRLSGLAAPSTFVVTRRVAEAADHLGLSVSPLGSLEVRGVHEPVQAYAIAPCDTGEHPAERDPVCGMRLFPTPATVQRSVGGGTVWFCEQRCAQRFDEAPDRYGSVV